MKGSNDKVIVTNIIFDPQNMGEEVKLLRVSDDEI